MRKQVPFILLIVVAFTIQSCYDNKKDINSNTKNVEVTDSLPHQEITEENESNPEEPNVTYPKTGNKVSDFLPESDIYDVQYQAEGDLNNDGLTDITVVLKHKQSNILKRPMLVLLQNEDKSYRLDKVSTRTIPVEYNEFDFKLYDTEDISIKKGELQINLYSMGLSGTHLSKFKYIQNDLVLNNIEEHYMGAGGRSGFFYDFEKGELTTTETNTMKEDEPTTSETKKVKIKPHLFEQTSVTEFFDENDKQF